VPRANAAGNRAAFLARLAQDSLGFDDALACLHRVCFGIPFNELMSASIGNEYAAHGRALLEWDAEADSMEARESVIEAERILREARDKGCAVSRRVGTRHVLDDAPFDPYVEEYQIIAPIAGG